MGVLDHVPDEEFMRDGKMPRCKHEVCRYSGAWPHWGQCSRAGKVKLDDGTWRCKQHAPETVAVRARAQDEKYDVEWARRRKEIHGGHFHDVLRQIADGHNDARGLARETLDEFDGG